MKIKEIKSTDFNLPISFEQEWNFEIDSIVKKAFDVTLEKLNKSYLDKGKITEDEKMFIRNAFENICEDLKNGGLQIGLHNYFLQNCEGLTLDEYNLKYQNIVEYLYKIFRNKILHELKSQ